eukprot:TRINITY_DN34887_c0_g1_i2.p1 TRINITY_DN34887_c0_g1~~TRINITY_DN34887_c0_g1_i2.p1  ORF type:complete len:415 (+),score=30.50 TRINITY_DN34887_c0_g1_i2:68-1312(+)
MVALQTWPQQPPTSSRKIPGTYRGVAPVRAVVVLRGYPGSGKSTLARLLLSRFGSEKAVICSNHEFWARIDGPYSVWRHEEAVQWCWQRFEDAVASGRHLIIIDNAHQTEDTFVDYIRAGQESGYVALVVSLVACSVGDAHICAARVPQLRHGRDLVPKKMDWQHSLRTVSHKHQVNLKAPLVGKCAGVDEVVGWLQRWSPAAGLSYCHREGPTQRLFTRLHRVLDDRSAASECREEEELLTLPSTPRSPATARTRLEASPRPSSTSTQPLTTTVTCPSTPRSPATGKIRTEASPRTASTAAEHDDHTPPESVGKRCREISQMPTSAPLHAGKASTFRPVERLFRAEAFKAVERHKGIPVAAQDVQAEMSTLAGAFAELLERSRFLTAPVAETGRLSDFRPRSRQRYARPVTAR